MTKPNTRGKTLTGKSNTSAEDRVSETPEPTSEPKQDINDSIEGRAYLEKYLLLCPPGEPPTHNSLATCLHQVAVMKGVSKPVMNAIRAVAFLLGEMEETQINEILKEAHQEKGMLLLTPFCSFLSFFYPFLAFESCKRQSKSRQHPPFTSLLLLLTPFER